MSIREKRLHLEMGRVVYGPVRSRRFGLSLGINPLPLMRKTCSFDCVYCQLGRTDNPLVDPGGLKDYPTPNRIADSLRCKLKSSGLNLDEINVVAFSGNGEPTLNPELGESVRRVREVLGEFGLDVPIIILTNSSLLGCEVVREGLAEFDLVVAKLDTADQERFLRINRPVVDMEVMDIIKHLTTLKKLIGDRLIVQVMVIDSTDEGLRNYGPEEASRMAELLSDVNPKLVQVYTIDRPPSESSVFKASEEKLSIVAEALKERLGEGRVKVYY